MTKVLANVTYGKVVCEVSAFNAYILFHYYSNNINNVVHCVDAHNRTSWVKVLAMRDGVFSSYCT